VEWRRRYGGRQRECVVCLEEYVDGVSRVMSLPCGHEFHAECITPWLTTRRRTCPICKGDVVRSLARSSAARTDSSASTVLRRQLSRDAATGAAADGLDVASVSEIDEDDIAGVGEGEDDVERAGWAARAWRRPESVWSEIGGLVRRVRGWRGRRAREVVDRDR